MTKLKDEISTNIMQTITHIKGKVWSVYFVFIKEK